MIPNCSYVCAEWNYGGLPVWLRKFDNITFRTVSPPWQDAMQRFVTRVLSEAIMLHLSACSLDAVFFSQVDSFLSKHGGPIIMLQIENEYGNIEIAFEKGVCFLRGWLCVIVLAILPQVLSMCSGRPISPSAIASPLRGSCVRLPFIIPLCLF